MENISIDANRLLEAGFQLVQLDEKIQIFHLDTFLGKLPSAREVIIQTPIGGEVIKALRANLDPFRSQVPDVKNRFRTRFIFLGFGTPKPQAKRFDKTAEELRVTIEMPKDGSFVQWKLEDGAGLGCRR